MPLTPPTFAALVAPQAARHWIDPGEVWPDDRGQHVQAHGGGVIRVGDTFYWFGEDRGRSNRPGRKYVACYSSTDLLNWRFRRQVVDMTAPDGLGDPGGAWVLERPHVFHNAATGKFVMYAHADTRNYAAAEVGVLVSDTVDGDYRFVGHFRPLGQESRDIGQFVDDDGSAYLIFEARPTHGFFIARLADDYLTVAKQTAFIKAPLEGGSLVKDHGLYYAVASYMSSSKPNNNQYATAARLEGPWSAFHDVAPPKAKTFGSQSTFLLKVVGDRQTTVIFMGDQWKPWTQWDSRYLWMPLRIGDGKLELPPPRPWTIDVRTGAVTLK